MTASPLLQLIVLSLCTLLVVSQLLEIGDSDLTDMDGPSQGFLGLLSRARPQYLKLQGGLDKRFSPSDMNSALSAAKRRSKNAKCMADFWKGRGLVKC